MDGLEMRRISPGPVRWKNQSVLRGMDLLVTRARHALPKSARACSASDSLLDQAAQERAVATVVVGAGAGAEQGEGLTCAHPAGDLLDPRPLSAHLAQVAGPVLIPGDRWTRLSVDGRVQIPAGGEIGVPLVPRLVLL